MQRVVDAVDFHIVPGLRQLDAVGLALVAQRVIFGGDDEGAGLAAQILTDKRRVVRVLQVVVAGAVELHVVDHPLAGQKVVGAVCAHRLEGGIFGVVVVGGRVQQNLLAGHEFPAVPRHQRDHRRQVSARAVADQGDVVGRDAEQVALGENFPRGQIAVLGRGGEAVLGGQAVVHRHHNVAGQAGHVGADLVVGVDVAGDPAAAVEEQQHGEHPLHFGGEDAHRHLVVAGQDVVVPDLIKGAQHMRVGGVDGGALQAVAVFLVQNLGVGERLEGGAHKGVDRHRAV